MLFESPAMRQRRVIVNAASRCLQQSGIAELDMDEVAQAAGVSRQALYRAFPNRQRLLEGILQTRLGEIVDEVLPSALASENFGEAFVDATLAAINYVRSTADLRRLLEETSIGYASKAMLHPESTTMKIAESFWQPILDWGRSRGEVRTDLVDRDAIGWTGTLVLV